ncbi:MAG: dephospho-CoA kinase [Paludibacter sp.]|nr:dephospho-CoA kinase [Bacteroidales bacterium]MCM1068879.1 dephospho-CoA kinase [Prevotella sp.]MCM1353140.1 dephospho-CoA kinase [Bacteroides sp.]MCM1442462.1 dephospho-CoA kinase [Muribaculum sp.]MCM1481305.1 dephospho-CoA kinase [Paludibacter sp.]
MKKTCIIGLTGGIGSGKSYIANALRAKGYPVYDSDREAQRIIHDNLCVRSQIELLFGSDIFVNDHYNKKKVASLVFSDPVLLDKLNHIVHPAVAFDIHTRVSNTNSQIFFVESAILYESGFDKLCNAVICISAPESVRIERVMQRDNLTQEQILARIHNQSATLQTAAKADLVLNNDGTQDIDQLCLQIQKFCCTFVD